MSKSRKILIPIKEKSIRRGHSEHRSGSGQHDNREARVRTREKEKEKWKKEHEVDYLEYV